jgi:hypothetical protein
VHALQIAEPAFLAALRLSTSALESSVAAGGLEVLARTLEDGRAFDLAMALPCGRILLVRNVSRVDPSDYRALATMLSQGTFARAILVYGPGEQPYLSDEIESWPIERVEEMAACLARETLL